MPDEADDEAEALSEAEEAKESELIGIPTHIYISFWYDRKWFNKILYSYYKLLRWGFVSFWYYFFPFVALMASYIVPRIFEAIPELDDQIQDAVTTEASTGAETIAATLL